MSDLEVRIERLQEARVASTQGFGPNPEEIAWAALGQWARARGLLDDLTARRFFGFNSPSPSPGSPNYGYEQWLTIDSDAQASEAVEIKDFPGGLYAVARCRLKDITDTWGELALWRESSRYRPAEHQWLEECLNPELFMPEIKANCGEATFDLYLPITE